MTIPFPSKQQPVTVNMGNFSVSADYVFHTLRFAMEILTVQMERMNLHQRVVRALSYLILSYLILSYLTLSSELVHCGETDSQVYRFEVCNGIPDCPNSEDEHNCGETLFQRSVFFCLSRIGRMRPVNDSRSIRLQQFRGVHST